MSEERDPGGKTNWLGPFKGAYIAICPCGWGLAYFGDPDLPLPTAAEMEEKRAEALEKGRPGSFFSPHDGDVLTCSNCGRQHAGPQIDPNEERRLIKARQGEIISQLTIEKGKAEPDQARLKTLRDNLVEASMKLLRVEAEARGATWEEADVGLPIVEATVIERPAGDGQVEKRPFVWLDAIERPDVTDLSRVLREHGTAGATGKLHFGKKKGELGLRVAFKVDDPVSCEFHFYLSWPKYDAFFRSVLEHGRFEFTVDEPGSTIGTTFTVDVPQEPLKIFLEGWPHI